MPRIARVVPDVGALHVIGRGNNKRNLFKGTRDYEYFLSLLEEYKTRYLCLIYHYVLMKNHAHLIVGLRPESRLSKMMHGICFQYALFYKKRRDHIGHLWQDRFKSYVIDNDDYLLTCGLYIEQNPVRAGVVAKPEDYPWSSYMAYAFGQKDRIVTLDPFYESLGNDAATRADVYRQMMERELEKIASRPA